MRLHIVIPFRDQWELTEIGLGAVFAQTMGQLSVTIHLIDNGSGPGTKQRVRGWITQGEAAGFAVTLQTVDAPFNFSRLCNTVLATTPAPGVRDYFLFLNNDVVLEDRSTLTTAVQFAEQNPNCGALSITLLYPDRKIQHLFAAPGVKIIAAHPFKGRPASILHEWRQAARQVPAVTGAFFLVAGDPFREVGGFDERLPTTGQDIDLCLKLQAKGLTHWVLPQLGGIHYESASRRRAVISKIEVDYIYAKWQDQLTAHVHYPLAISRWSEQPVFRLFEGVYPYKRLLR